ncbi:MAG TPA: hypothetical protein VJR89_36305 [Polyangiales bacterium]|nr:hypothetical protein [Polyangiales bacterium]
MPKKERRPVAKALPNADDKITRGRYGSMMPVTPANGFTIIAKVKPGCAPAIRAYGQKIESTIRESPEALAVLRLHYLRWILFDNDTRFIYMGIFDTDFDKYVEDAVMLFKSTGIATVFEQLDGFPTDWRENPAAFAQFCRDHQAHSFMEYAEYPDVTAVEVKKALTVKDGLSDVLDQLQ